MLHHIFRVKKTQERIVFIYPLMRFWIFRVPGSSPLHQFSAKLPSSNCNQTQFPKDLHPHLFHWGTEQRKPRSLLTTPIRFSSQTASLLQTGPFSMTLKDQEPFPTRQGQKHSLQLKKKNPSGSHANHFDSVITRIPPTGPIQAQLWTPVSWRQLSKCRSYATAWRC